ncbi:hypothetical protein [Caballeronia pedi]|uniref:hypothetical protein n=1 Tax=Caballeronia pedi TaxID=1777141 RepID=UPI0011788AC7|nr:hypothetical protein [Caballeronia pedi]
MIPHSIRRLIILMMNRELQYERSSLDIVTDRHPPPRNGLSGVAVVCGNGTNEAIVSLFTPLLTHLIPITVPTAPGFRTAVHAPLKGVGGFFDAFRQTEPIL